MYLAIAAFVHVAPLAAIAIGTAGLLMAIPVLFMPAVAAYTLGHCAWWIWLAVPLLREGSLEAAQGRHGLAVSPSA